MTRSVSRYPNHEGMGVNTFIVAVRNELTGEIRHVEIVCDYDKDAQVLALVSMFRQQAWRKATALPAVAKQQELSA